MYHSFTHPPQERVVGVAVDEDGHPGVVPEDLLGGLDVMLFLLTREVCGIGVEAKALGGALHILHEEVEGDRQDQDLGQEHGVDDQDELHEASD